MVDLVATRASVIGCFASAEALDALDDAFRVAPDEAMLIGPQDAAQTLARAAAERVASLDGDGLVLDMSDGWTVWTLAGEDTAPAFAHLSAVEIPDIGFTSGDVVRIPARILARGGRIHLIVPSMWRDYLRERVIEGCRDLGVREAGTVGWEEP